MIALWQLEFVQNAFIAGTIVAVLAAVVGYFAVLRTQAFATEALSDIGFAGATGAALLGINALMGTFVFTLLAAYGIGVLGERVRGRDLEIGMVLAFALGLGVLFLNLYTQFATETVNILFGSLLSVSHETIAIITWVSLAVLLVMALLFRPLLFASIDPEVAEARGVPVRLLSISFMFVLAITVSEAVQVVGVLLVFALIIAPAASAEKLTNRPNTTLALSIVLGLVYTWGGLLLAFVGHWPASFYISALAAISYFIALFVHRVRVPRRYKQPQNPCMTCDSNKQGYINLPAKTKHAYNEQASVLEASE